MSQSIQIRMANAGDAAALCALYAPYVRETVITFEYEVPSVEEFSRRMEKIFSRYPYLVAEADGLLLGYAYAAPFKERAAYDWAVETTIYLAREHHGQGLGAKLYLVLEELLRAQRITNANACIAYPHPQSIRFHKRMGYRTVGHFSKCGYKLGQWCDMVWMEKLLGEHPEQPGPVLPASALSFEPVWV